MTDALRLGLLLLLAGTAVTVAAAGLAWWNRGERRLARLIRKVLGGAPDAAVISPGRRAAAGLRLDSDKAVVMWNGGAGALLYPLSALEGAELLVDDVVAARVWRGEPRRALDAINKTARQVTLRLVFDNPRDPEFVLDLWLPNDAERRDDRGPGPAIAEARTWLARVEALLRRPRTTASVARPLAPEPFAPETAYEPEEDSDLLDDDSGELPF